jgi:epoxyqueuosine reductase
VKQSAMRRIGREQLKRNAAVALGNSGDLRAVAPLVRALGSESSVLVREHAAWALGQLGGLQAHSALVLASADDVDEVVREEARRGLAHLDKVGSRDDGACPD